MKNLFGFAVVMAFVCSLANADERNDEPWPDLLAEKMVQVQSGRCIINKNGALLGFTKTDEIALPPPIADVRFVHCARNIRSRQVVVAETLSTGEIKTMWIYDKK